MLTCIIPDNGVILGLQLLVHLPQVLGSDHLDLGYDVMLVTEVDTFLNYDEKYYHEKHALI